MAIDLGCVGWCLGDEDANVGRGVGGMTDGDGDCCEYSETCFGQC